MQYFKIRQDGFKEIRRQILIKTIPILLISIIVGVTISSINSKDKITGVNGLPIIIPFITVLVGFGLYRGINGQKELFESYQLNLTNNLITREQFNTPTISIYFNDIKEIVKNKNGSFTVKGKDPTDLIGIPAQIDNYFELEMALSQIRPIVTKSNKSFLEKYIIVVIILTLGSMVCVYTMTNKIIVALSGTILVSILSWSFYEMHRNKNIDAKAKRGIWVILIMLASVIFVMIIKLFGVPVA